MKSRQEILYLLESNSSRLREFGVSEIGVFGSVARGEQTDNSDVDVIVQLEHETLSSYMNVLFFLEELFERRVDLVIKDTLKPAIRDRVLADTIYVQSA